MEGKGFPGPTACRAKAIYNTAWLERKCDCAEHNLSLHWYDVTGDSFVVDVRNIYSLEGAIGYLGKYLRKGFNDREALFDLGYKRRYDRSRNWCGRSRRVGSVFKVWDKHQFEYGLAPDTDPAVIRAETDPMMEFVESPEITAVNTRRRLKSVLNQSKTLGNRGSGARH